ncbi:hypothetical protein BDA99DRAFT_541117 [Phascolomyces articulosus]|uniref:Uncharacterized protein n=1 Tax=Phascolomyces articulosus TaxID=60185 RepID=A0AAD5K2A5_9FUNG|nr:hypothetical protein BDA99DRAFT_541117 [Phascolomyces articulosus]
MNSKGFTYPCYFLMALVNNHSIITTIISALANQCESYNDAEKAWNHLMLFFTVSKVKQNVAHDLLKGKACKFAIIVKIRIFCLKRHKEQLMNDWLSKCHIRHRDSV